MTYLTCLCTLGVELHQLSPCHTRTFASQVATFGEIDHGCQSSEFLRSGSAFVSPTFHTDLIFLARKNSDESLVYTMGGVDLWPVMMLWLS